VALRLRNSAVGYSIFCGSAWRAWSQCLEVVQEILEEVADARVVAVAQDGLVLKMLLVMDEFLFDVGKLGVEFILLCRLGGV
jgi:hypothetical protein